MRAAARPPMTLIRFLVLLCALFGPVTIAAAGPARYANVAGVAIAGFDPVAYFAEHRAVEGRMANALRWHGTVWYFATPDNRSAFEMNPHAYAPQYGGYCAVAVGRGRLAPASPQAFVIFGGKLYLTDPGDMSTWKADPAGAVARADAAWPTLGGQ